MSPTLKETNSLENGDTCGQITIPIYFRYHRTFMFQIFLSEIYDPSPMTITSLF